MCIRDRGKTYREDDLIGAAESVFGKGAKGLGRVIQSSVKKQRQPNGCRLYTSRCV